MMVNPVSDAELLKPNVSHEQLREFGTLLFTRRRELGLSGRAVSKKVGISPPYLVALERATNPKTGRPSIPSYRILDGLGLTLNLEHEIHRIFSYRGFSYGSVDNETDPFKIKFDQLVTETFYSATKELLPRARDILEQMRKKTSEEAERNYRELRGHELLPYVEKLRNRDYASEFVRRLSELYGSTANYSDPTGYNGLVENMSTDEDAPVS